jgi:hypothetical protein
MHLEGTSGEDINEDIELLEKITGEDIDEDIENLERTTGADIDEDIEHLESTSGEDIDEDIENLERTTGEDIDEDVEWPDGDFGESDVNEGDLTVLETNSMSTGFFFSLNSYFTVVHFTEDESEEQGVMEVLRDLDIIHDNQVSKYTCSNIR